MGKYIKSFQWVGWDKSGISKWAGDGAQTLRVVGKGFRIYSFIAAIYGFFSLAMLLKAGVSSPWLAVTIIGLTHTVVFGGIGFWFLRLHKQIASLTAEKELCNQLMTDTEGLKKLAEQRGIKAKMIINNEYFYDSNDFTEAGVLLRPSLAPSTDPQELLRATNTSQPTKPDELLRPASTTKLKADITIDEEYLRKANQEQNTKEDNKKPLFLRREK